MSRSSHEESLFCAMVRRSFPDLTRAKVTLRTITPPTGPRVVIAFQSDLVEQADLHSLVLAPLASGLPDASPTDLLQTAIFPAKELTVLSIDGPAQKGLRSTAQRPTRGRIDEALQHRLLAGYIAIYVCGHSGVLLVGTRRHAQPSDSFGPDLHTNVVLLRRSAHSPRLFIERMRTSGGSESVVAYIHEQVSPPLLDRVRRWASSLEHQPPSLVWWQQLIRPFQLPLSLPCSSPAQAADALRRGHVAVLAESLPETHLAPLTLDLLLSGSRDMLLPRSLRRILLWPRIAAALTALMLSATFVSIAGYHHALLPAPFLMAMAAGQQNTPFPTLVGVVLAELIGDGMRTATAALGTLQWSLLGALGSALITFAALAAGIISPVAVVVANFTTIALLVVPNRPLVRRIMLWRYLFIFAAGGLGMFGVSLLFFLLISHLAGHYPFGHPMRQPLEENHPRSQSAAGPII